VSALIHRAATGEAEFHENMADFFVVRSGHGTLVIGGQLKDSRSVAPGEMAAVAIDGGERRAIGPGDVIYIPAKLPHHVLVDRGEPLSYLIIKAKE
jgi:mannose-6-phosphate isomerase-like protein (cupin superfamily)